MLWNSQQIIISSRFLWFWISDELNHEETLIEFQINVELEDKSQKELEETLFTFNPKLIFSNWPFSQLLKGIWIAKFVK
jgi:hypothetical protein